MTICKKVTYTANGYDQLRRYYSLADLKEFVAQIVADHPDTKPEDVRLRIDGGLSADVLFMDGALFPEESTA